MSSVITTSPGAAAATPLLSSFQEHYAALLRFLTRRAGNPEIARDLAHDTWLRLAQCEGGAIGVADPRAYVFTVAANLALDRLRRTQRAADHEQGLEEALAPDVADVHAHRQALRAVADGLQDLPARAQDCFLAHRLDGVGHAELARQHGVSVKTIERDMALAMQRVRAAMEHLQGRSRPEVSKGRRRALSALLGVAGLGTASAIAWKGWEAAVDDSVLVSGPGGPLEHGLPDGSRITLDAGSRLVCAFDPVRRGARLEQGAAFFEIGRETGWLARGFSVRVLQAALVTQGARFSVEILGAAVRIEVDSGSVMLKLSSGGVLPIGPHEAAVARDGTVTQPSPLAGPAGAWRQGWLEFDRVPLAEVIERISRHQPRRLRVAYDAATLRVVARVDLRHVDDWLRLLPRILPVEMGPLDGGTWLIRRR